MHSCRIQLLRYTAGLPSAYRSHLRKTPSLPQIPGLKISAMRSASPCKPCSRAAVDTLLICFSRSSLRFERMCLLWNSKPVVVFYLMSISAAWPFLRPNLSKKMISSMTCLSNRFARADRKIPFADHVCDLLVSVSSFAGDAASQPDWYLEDRLVH